MTWISVKDEEPETMGRYLVLINNQVAIMNWGYCYLNPMFGLIRVYNGWENDHLNAPISHWMPLPDPPT